MAGEIIYRAAVKSDINFSGIDFKTLAVYLFLVLGASVMVKCGLEKVVPVRKSNSKARSLLAKSNKDLNEWSVNTDECSQDMKKQMLGRLLQILTIVLMSSSCYSFGGKIYRQREGAGIGERGSACIARTIMSLWDKFWASSQARSGLFCPLFIRYVDDVRIYLHPINDGWRWNNYDWVYDADYTDGLSYEERTKRNILNTLNGILDGILLTVESESDFLNGMLPTLDFQTRVRPNGEIEFLHYMKPMASQLVIQYGTALGKQTIFASLRQELIRRLLHISDHFGVAERVEVVEKFTQSLANSGHSYSFTKSIVLQALTRFKTMKSRANLLESNARYLPLYRDKWYNYDKRKMIKGTLGMTWYSGVNYGDKYKQEWKRKIKRKGGKIVKKEKLHERPSTVMFVPSTPGGTLLQMLEDLEGKLRERGDTTWSVKLVEKSGKPLKNMFGAKSPIIEGCPLGETCRVCDNDAKKCAAKGVVYLAECNECSLVDSKGGESMAQGLGVLNSRYVGETSRPLRMRANEHWTNLLELNTDSFILTHWMNKHGLQMRPPEYKFKVLGCYRDSLSRQIAEAVFIEDRGKLNKRSEFGVNHIPRLEVSKSERERDATLEKEAYERANLVSNLTCFKSVILKVYDGKFNNRSSTCRSTQSKRVRAEDIQQGETAGEPSCLRLEGNKRRKKMFSSTPIWSHRKPKGVDSSADSQAESLISQDNSLESLNLPLTPAKTGPTTLQAAGITPQLSRLLKRPCNEDDYESTRLILQETINLTRAAIVNGLIIEDLHVDEYMIKLCENSMYKPLRHIELDPMIELLQGLDLNCWAQSDLTTDPVEGLIPLDKNRDSALLKVNILRYDSSSMVGDENFINLSTTGNYSVDVEEKIINVDVDEKIIIMDSTLGQNINKHSRGGDNEHSRGKNDTNVTFVRSLNDYVNELIQQSVELTGIGLETLTKKKRKALSPPNLNQIQRAEKIQAVGVGASPELRKRNIIGRKAGSPTGDGQVQSHVLGRVKKHQKRRISTPKRTYTPDKKQLLITSSFSPKPRDSPLKP